MTDEEQSRRPFEKITTEEELDEKRDPRLRPFEDEVVHHIIHVLDEKIPTGNIFDAELFEPEPAQMILKKLRDEGYDA